MNESYDTYIETINGLEVVEAQVIKDSKIKRCCYLSLEFVKSSYYLFDERYNRK